MQRRVTETAGICVAIIGCAVSLQGCGGGITPSPPAPSPPAPSPPANPHCKARDPSGLCQECYEGYEVTGPNKICLYGCTSNLQLGPVAAAAKKGLMMDDTTHHWCPDSLHGRWANTAEPVKSIRIAKAWEADWPADQKTKAWDSIKTFLSASGSRALVGTSLSCNETNDDKDWHDVLELLKDIGPDNVMGLSIGNEMELQWQQKDSASCVKQLWQGGYVLRKFSDRVKDLDALGSAWKSVKVTSVFSEYIFAGSPFVHDNATADVLTFVKSVLQTYGSRYAFSLNNYPYFDTGNHLDQPNTDKCEGAIKVCTCFDNPQCKFVNAVVTMRQRMQGVAAADNVLWITETGWSSPKASTLKWDPAHNAKFEMANCTEFSALSTMQSYYDNFLKWDLSIPGSTGPDHVFFFTMRDAPNFGQLEHFGLGGSGDPTKLCVNTTCKLQKASRLPASIVV